MKVLVVGSGGREHALVRQVSQSKRIREIYAAPGNAGIKDLANIVGIKASNIIELADFAQEKEIDLTIVGPEGPLSLGIVDEFTRRNLKIFGPTQKAATLESSKSFAKEFMKKIGIPTAGFKTFKAAQPAVDYLKKAKYPTVVKADGLAAGKGVFICANLTEAAEAIKLIMVEKKFGKSGNEVIIEDYLEGQEMSFIAISDGKRVVPLVTSMDYKKALENDKGSNTGGMGAISPSPRIDKELYDTIMKSIIYPTIEGMKFEGKAFRGVLYAGLMITGSGPLVLEYNVRFGDPETQAVLLRLNSDIVDLLEGSVDGNLCDIPVEWEEGVSACVVLTSKGYPHKYEAGKKIMGLERAKALGVEIFHAGTVFKDNDFYTAGGRVLNICARCSTLKETMSKIYDAVSFISYDNINFRQDIGKVVK
ncbi:MAG: phosphoribosylamine--glycine ligase [Candidatus Aminicenantes bacterium]|nr:phosphoribosylamine--glycine ligase [Candidatus Aminicenantes bacterium]